MGTFGDHLTSPGERLSREKAMYATPYPFSTEFNKPSQSAAFQPASQYPYQQPIGGLQQSNFGDYGLFGIGGKLQLYLVTKSD